MQEFTVAGGWITDTGENMKYGAVRGFGFCFLLFFLLFTVLMGQKQRVRKKLFILTTQVGGQKVQKKKSLGTEK